MISALLIDDEPNNLDNLSILLQQYCPAIAVTGTAMNAAQARLRIATLQPDLVFLDIQMPDESGFALLQSLPEITFEIIFVTAFDQYGINAIKFSALDYLLKPIAIEELTGAVEKAIKRITEKKQNSNIQNLLQLLQSPLTLSEHKIALPDSRETRLVPAKDIIRCQSQNVYTTFFFSNGEKLVVSKAIKEYEELLTPYGFIRSHQSHLVNKRHIKSFIKEDNGYLLMADGFSAPIARQKKEYVKRVLQLNNNATKF
jgi:two-component system LytT family response regulator